MQHELLNRQIYNINVATMHFFPYKKVHNIYIHVVYLPVNFSCSTFVRHISLFTNLYPSARLCSTFYWVSLFSFLRMLVLFLSLLLSITLFLSNNLVPLLPLFPIHFRIASHSLSIK